MLRGADSGSFLAPEWQIYRRIGSGTVDLDNSGAYALKKSFDPLRRGGKDGGSQTFLHTADVANRDKRDPRNPQGTSNHHSSSDAACD